MRDGPHYKRCRYRRFSARRKIGTSRGEVSQGSGTTVSVGLCADLLPARVANGLSTST